MFTLMITIVMLAVVIMRTTVSGVGALYLMAMLGDVALAYIFRDFIIAFLMSF